MVRINQLTFGLKKTHGINNLGRITAFHRGGGVKRIYRILDFKRNIRKINAYICGIFYDPNRSSYISLICYDNGILSYILTPFGLKRGDSIRSLHFSQFKFNNLIGNTYLLSNIPVGSLVHNISLKEKKNAQYIRSAGTYGIVLKQFDNGSTLVKLPSLVKYIFGKGSFATIGQISNINYNLQNKKKAGTNRLLNRRPIVRGVVMNPVDHPHGGGEGKSSGGRPSVSPWGKLTKGPKTRKKKKFKKFLNY